MKIARLIFALVAAGTLIASADAEIQLPTNTTSSIPQFGSYVRLSNATARHPGLNNIVVITNSVTYQAPCDGFVVDNSSDYSAYSTNDWSPFSFMYNIDNFQLSMGTNPDNLNITFRSDHVNSKNVRHLAETSG
jgi:hypothetical protein